MIKTTAFVLLLIAPALPAVLQQNVTTKPTSVDQQSKAVGQKGVPLDLKKKVLSVLERQLEAQKTFADENLRLAIQTTVADMLWAFDEPRSRRLLEEAFQAIVNVKTDERGWPLTRSSNVPYVVIRTIATHDPAMALRLQQSIEIPSDLDPWLTAQGNGTSLYAVRARIQNDLAMYIVIRYVSTGETKNGELRDAIQAVKPFVERGDFQRTILFARSIRAKDSAAADEIFSQVLTKASLGHPSFDDIRHLSRYVFPNLGAGVLHYPEKKVDTFEATPISTELRNQFLDLAYNVVTERLGAALANAEGARLDVRSLFDYSVPKAFVPFFDRYLAADRAATVRARLAEVARRIAPEEQPYLAVAEPGIEGLVSIAEKVTDPRTRDFLYDKAATRARFSGDFDLATALIEKISNEIIRDAQRYNLRSQIDSNHIQETFNALGAKDLDRAQKLIAEITDQRQRLQMYGSLIGNWVLKDRPRATSMLEESERRASTIEDPIERAWGLKMLAGIGGRIDSSRAFEKMSLAVAEFNHAGFVAEWEKTQHIETPAGISMKILQSGLSGLLDDGDFTSLGRIDLDRALMLAEQLQLKEASALAQLAACRGALSITQTAAR